MQAQVVVCSLEAAAFWVWKVGKLLVLGVNTLLPPQGTAFFTALLALPAPLSFSRVLLLPAVSLLPMHLEGKDIDSLEVPNSVALEGRGGVSACAQVV